MKPPRAMDGTRLVLDADYACERCCQMFTYEELMQNECACTCGAMMTKLDDLNVGFSTNAGDAVACDPKNVPTETCQLVQVVTEFGHATRAGQLATIESIDTEAGVASIFLQDIGPAGVTAHKIPLGTLKSIQLINDPLIH